MQPYIQRLTNAVMGGLTNAINDHGPITHGLKGSAAKRIVGQIRGLEKTNELKDEVRRELTEELFSKMEKQESKIKRLSKSVKYWKEKAGNENAI